MDNEAKYTLLKEKVMSLPMNEPMSISAIAKMTGLTNYVTGINLRRLEGEKLVTIKPFGSAYIVQRVE